MNWLRSYLRLCRLAGIHKRDFGILFVLLACATVFEGVGIGILIPIFESISRDGRISLGGETPGFLQAYFNVVDAIGLERSLGSLLVLFFITILFRQIFAYARQIYLFACTQRFIKNARNKVFEAYLNAKLDFQDSEQSGHVVNSMTTELLLGASIIFAPVLIATYVFYAIFYSFILIFLVGPVTFVAVAIIGLAAFLLKRTVSNTFLVGETVTEANQRMAAFLLDRLGSPRLIRLSGAQAREVSEMKDFTQQQYQSIVGVQTKIALVNSSIEPIVIGVCLVVLYFGSIYFHLSLAQFGIFMLIAIVRLVPIARDAVSTVQTMAGFWKNLSMLESRVERMQAAAESSSGQRIFASLGEGIRFDRVSFRYGAGDARPALTNIDLLIPARGYTALVGPSGAGKSTLIDLIPRLRDATSGCVTIDHIPVADYSLESLRAGIGYVPQDPLSFDITIAQHISYGATAQNVADDAAMRHAAQLAGALSFVEALPDGFKTRMGERGVRLSGGQRQRLDIARALFRKAPILILDEPTSNLDAESESEFKKTLADIHRNTQTTMVVVAHRLSTIADADQIAVLRDGRIEEVGDHDALMARNGWYASAFRKQQREHRSAAE